MDGKYLCKQYILHRIVLGIACSGHNCTRLGLGIARGGGLFIGNLNDVHRSL